MIEWKQIDYLMYRIPCEWQPRLFLDRSCGSVKLYRLRLPARTPGEDLTLRIKRGSSTPFRRMRLNYEQLQQLKPMAEDLKAVATTLGFVPIAEQKKVKSLWGWDAVEAVPPTPPPPPVSTIPPLPENWGASPLLEADSNWATASPTDWISVQEYVNQLYRQVMSFPAWTYPPVVTSASGDYINIEVAVPDSSSPQSENPQAQEPQT